MDLSKKRVILHNSTTNSTNKSGNGSRSPGFLSRGSVQTILKSKSPGLLRSTNFIKSELKKSPSTTDSNESNALKSHYEETINKLKEKGKQIGGDLVNKEKENELLKERISELEQFSKMNDKLAILEHQNEIYKADNEEKNAEIRELNDKIKLLVNENKILTNNDKQYLFNINNKENTIVKLSNEIISLKNAIIELQRDNQNLKDELQGCMEKIEKLSKENQINEINYTKYQQLLNFENKYSQIQHLYNNTLKEIESLQASLLTNKNLYNKEIDSYKTIINKQNNEIKQLREDILNIQYTSSDLNSPLTFNSNRNDMNIINKYQLEIDNLKKVNEHLYSNLNKYKELHMKYYNLNKSMKSNVSPSKQSDLQTPNRDYSKIYSLINEFSPLFNYIININRKYLNEETPSIDDILNVPKDTLIDDANDVENGDISDQHHSIIVKRLMDHINVCCDIKQLVENFYAKSESEANCLII